MTLSDAPLKVVMRPVDSLIPYVNNSRTHSKDQISLIASSIKEFGFNDPIAIDRNAGIISGHGRLSAAQLLGLKEVPTIELSHLTRDQQKAYVIAHNRIALSAGWDSELLRIELQELKDAGFDLIVTGFGDEEIDKLLNPNQVIQGLCDPDNIPEIPIEPLTLSGDIWILGNHRLMCGDATNPLHVNQLTKDFNPNLMVTDPPYGVNYEPQWREEAGKRIGETSTGKVDNDDKVDWSDAYSLFTGDVCYVWHAAIFSPDIGSHLRSLDFNLISQIIWVKQHFAISRGDYHWQHEPCWYAVKRGKNHHWQGARDQKTTWDIMNNNSFGNGKTEKTWGHGTQKPIECMSRPIQNNSKTNEYVYDPFGGSGTTLIACEKHVRKCLMMEISSKYCDVIVRRWEDFTGKKAILESNGKTFKELENERIRARSAA